MSKILISGYYGFANAGDEAMLTAIVDSLRAKDKNVDLTVISGNPKATGEKHKVKAVHRFSMGEVFSAMQETDLLLSGGGSLLQDVTSTKSLFYYLSILALGKILGKKVVIYAQGIGPINGSFARSITGFICSKADLITVRDDGSLEELKNMGIPLDKIHVTSDAVFALPKAEEKLGVELLSKYNLGDKPLIGLALRHWQGEEHFTREFAKTAQSLVEKYDAQLVFIPLQFPQDAQISETVKSLMGEAAASALILDKSLTAAEYIALISRLKLLIGMRLHALVFAALNNVPFLAVSYDPKVDRFVNAMDGKVVGKIDNITAEEIVLEAEKLWVDAPQKENAKILSLRQEAQANIQRVVDLMGD